MKVTILLWIIGAVIMEGLRFFVAFDRLANEIQLLSAVPWIPSLYHMWKLHERHKQLEKRLNGGQHDKGK